MMIKLFQNLKVRQSIAFIFSLFVLLVVLDELEAAGLTPLINDNSKRVVSASITTAQLVNVLPNLNLLASVEPIKLSQITSQVSGKVIKISNALRPGSTLQKDRQLLTIDPLPYQVAVAEADAGLISAKIELKKTRIQFSENSLAVKLANAQLVLAESQLTQANAQLKQTKITLPFDAEITEIHAYLGEYITIGQQIISVLPKANKHISVAVNEQDFTRLASLSLGQLVTLTSIDKQHRWSSEIVSISQHTNNLQRNIYLKPINNENEKSPLYGQHVYAQLPLKGWSNTLSLPESALTLKGELWWLNNQEQAYKTKLNDYIIANNKVYFPQHNNKTEQSNNSSNRALLFPLASLSQGMKIMPLVAQASEL
jgi:multidrug efflux pump subunit AcrA (membrane-fusion protein)